MDERKLEELENELKQIETDERFWWEVICKLEELPRDYLVYIYRSLANEADSEVRARGLGDTYNFALDYELARAGRLSKEELCTRIRSLWNRWEEFNQQVFAGPNKCSNDEFMTQEFPDIDPDELMVINQDGTNYCFTAQELERFRGRNPYTNLALPEGTNRRLRRRLDHLNTTHVKYGERKEDETLPEEPLPRISPLEALFDDLGIEEYVPAIEALSGGQLQRLGERIKSAFEDILETLALSHEDIRQRLKPMTYSNFIRQRTTFSLNTWLEQLIIANGDVLEDLTPIINNSVIEISREPPEAHARVERREPTRLEQIFDVIAEQADASHLDSTILEDFSPATRRFIVAWMKHYINSLRLRVALRSPYTNTMIDYSWTFPTVDNITDILYDIYNNGHNSRERLVLFSNFMSAVLQGSDQEVQDIVSGVISRDETHRIFRRSQYPMADWLQEHLNRYVSHYILGTMRGLILNDRDVTELPEDIGSMTMLEDLTMANNHLSRLPESISQLQNLSHIDISNNNFEELPIVLGSLPQLRAIDANLNPIQTISDDFPAMDSLERLSLSSTQLEHLPERFGEMFPNLVTLNLSETPLRTVPESFFTLRNLRNLYLERTTNLSTSLRRRLRRLVTGEEAKVPAHLEWVIGSLRRARRWSEHQVETIIDTLTEEEQDTLTYLLRLLDEKVTQFPDASRELLDDYIWRHESDQVYYQQIHGYLSSLDEDNLPSALELLTDEEIGKIVDFLSQLEDVIITQEDEQKINADDVTWIGVQLEIQSLPDRYIYRLGAYNDEGNIDWSEPHWAWIDPVESEVHIKVRHLNDVFIYDVDGLYASEENENVVLELGVPD